MLAFPMGSDKEVEQRAQYIAKSMLKPDMRGRLWFAPYNGGNHWMLGVIDPLQNKIYWLDPLHGEVRDDFMEIATNAMEAVNNELFKDDNDTTRLHRKRSKVKKKPIVWKKVKGPQQPNNFQCGYYICRYMLELKKYFSDSPQHCKDY